MKIPNQITVRIEDGTTVQCAPHSEVCQLVRDCRSPSELPYIGALVNNEVTSLTYALEVDCQVKFLTMDDPHGWRIYERSICFLLAKTAHELFPDWTFSLEYSFGAGLYCDFEEKGTANRVKEISADEIGRIAARLRDLVARDVPILRRKMSFADALREFESAGQADKVSLLKYRNPPNVVVYVCEGYADLAHGPVASRTGALNYFDLIPYPPGFVLQLPAKGKPTEVAPFKDQPRLFQIFQEHKEWGRILGVNTVGRLNEVIASGEISAFIKVSEALHEKKVARIADRITAQLDRTRIVLVSGPSSAGKTTFTKRLAIQLRVNGLRPLTISLDNYFFERDKTPRDEKGNYDFEHIEAIDIDFFNRQLLQLLRGEEVELPCYNFEAKKREFRGEKVQIAPDQILVIEGIHGINPRLTHMIPAEQKLKIYISALTQLSIDSENRISTTDNRLLRRIIRDFKYRDHTALMTLRMWPSVRQGEETWVFPFQGAADAMFNSALDYELAVLKPMVEPLLMQIKPSDPEYAEARRLTAFLLNFLQIPDREVPSTSILREYIGRSSFHY